MLQKPSRPDGTILHHFKPQVNTRLLYGNVAVDYIGKTLLTWISVYEALSLVMLFHHHQAFLVREPV